MLGVQQNHRLLLALLVLVTIVALTGCPAQAEVGIAAVVDKQSGQRVNVPTTVTMTVFSREGRELRSTECNDNWDALSVRMDSTGKEQLFVRVEAPGYLPWERTIGPAPGAGEMLTVELVPLAEAEAFRARLGECAADLEHLLVIARRDGYPRETVEEPLSEALDWLRETDRRLGEFTE